jgi:thymidylate kinase
LRKRIVVGDDDPRSPGLPHAYLFLDLPAEVAYDRCRTAASEKQTVFDIKPLRYHEHVREGFNVFAAQYGTERTKMANIDANRPVEAIQAQLRAIIEGIFEADDDKREG